MARPIEHRSLNPAAEYPKHKRGLRYAAALGAGAFAMLGSSAESDARVLEPMALNASAIPRLGYGPKAAEAAEAKTFHKLINPEKLRGYNIKVSPERRKLQYQATIKIVARYKGSSTQWYPWCSATLVELPADIKTQQAGDDTAEAISAAHCFNDDSKQGQWPSGYDPALPAYAEVSAAGPYEYAVVDPLIEGELQPFGTVTAISANTKGSDWAMLKIAPIKDNPPAGRRLSDFPRLRFSGKVHTPIPGQEVALAGQPAGSSKMVSGVGRFLGTVNYLNYAYKEVQMDVVGVNSQTEEFDASQPIAAFEGRSCFWGLSGGSAAGYNYMSGVLTKRINTKTDPKYVVEVLEKIPPDNPEYENRVRFIRDYAAEERRTIQEALGVNTSKFDTLCLYQTAPGLRRGKNNKLPASNIIKPLYNALQAASP